MLQTDIVITLQFLSISHSKILFTLLQAEIKHLFEINGVTAGLLSFSSTGLCLLRYFEVSEALPQWPSESHHRYRRSHPTRKSSAPTDTKSIETVTRQSI